MPFFLIICTSFYQNISLWIARDGEAKSRCAIWNGPFWFELQFDILFLGTTSLRWIDYIFSLALRFIYNCRGDFIFWRFWSFFLWSHEISTKLGHISFEEYAEAPSISLQHESVHRLKFSNFQYLNGICSYLCNIFRKENSPFNICF